MKLNQALAIEGGKKTQAYQFVTKAHQALQKESLVTGVARTYRPTFEDEAELPPETKLVQLRVPNMIKNIMDVQEQIWDITLTKERGNQQAQASVIVDDQILFSDVPVTFLLFLEKQLADMKTFVEKLPVLDPAEKWEWSNEANCYESEERSTSRTRKVPKTLVKYDATPEHPAQTEVYHEDIVVGFWTQKGFSGAIPAVVKQNALTRITKVAEAVKIAREEANSIDVTNTHESSPMLQYLFEDIANISA